MVLIGRHLLTYGPTRCFALRKMWVEAGLSVHFFFALFRLFLFFSFFLFSFHFFSHSIACVGEPPPLFFLSGSVHLISYV